MKDHGVLKIGEKLYLAHKEIIVLKVYYIFHFAMICYVGDDDPFWVDCGSLTEKPDYTSSISIKVFRES